MLMQEKVYCIIFQHSISVKCIEALNTIINIKRFLLYIYNYIYYIYIYIKCEKRVISNIIVNEMALVYYVIRRTIFNYYRKQMKSVK